MEYILDNYIHVSENEPNSKNPMAYLIRNELPRIFRSKLENPRNYSIRGSAGVVRWAKIPWIGFLNNMVSSTFKSGYYVAYIFKEDMSGFYLSLMLGDDFLRKNYGDENITKTANTVRKFIQKKFPKTRNYNPMDLAFSNQNYLAFRYQRANIYSIEYTRDNLPSDKKLILDLRFFLRIYDYVYESKYLNLNENNMRDVNFNSNIEVNSKRNSKSSHEPKDINKINQHAKSYESDKIVDDLNWISHNISSEDMDKFIEQVVKIRSNPTMESMKDIDKLYYDYLNRKYSKNKKINDNRFDVEKLQPKKQQPSRTEDLNSELDKVNNERNSKSSHEPKLAKDIYKINRHVNSSYESDKIVDDLNWISHNISSEDMDKFIEQVVKIRSNPTMESMKDIDKIYYDYLNRKDSKNRKIKDNRFDVEKLQPKKQQPSKTEDLNSKLDKILNNLKNIDSDNSADAIKNVFDDYISKKYPNNEINGNDFDVVNIQHTEKQTNKRKSNKKSNRKHKISKIESNPNGYYNFKDHSNRINKLSELLNSDNIDRLNEFNLSKSKFDTIIERISSTHNMVLDNLIKENNVDFEGLRIIDKMFLFSKAFVKTQYKAGGGDYGFYRFNEIYIDDRSEIAFQITTIIHELSHFLLSEILEQILSELLNSEKTDMIEAFVYYILTDDDFHLIDEYCAHTVEGRYALLGYQDYSSYNNILEEADITGVDYFSTIGNTFAKYIKLIMESFIDEDLRDLIKKEFNELKDDKRYDELQYETDKYLDWEDFKSAIKLILTSKTFDLEIEEIEAIIDFSYKFKETNNS